MILHRPFVFPAVDWSIAPSISRIAKLGFILFFTNSLWCTFRQTGLTAAIFGIASGAAGSAGNFRRTNRHRRFSRRILFSAVFRPISLLLFGFRFGDLRHNQKLPQHLALRRHHHEFQVIPFTPIPVAFPRSTLQRYTLQPC